MIELKDAIEIARVISKVPEERMRLILSVFEKADLTIDGIEELEAWAISRDRNNLVDITDFIASLSKNFGDKKDGSSYIVPAATFTEFCKNEGLDARAVRAWLARKGYIETTESNGKTDYTVSKRIDGKLTRCVVIREVAN